eukprot:scaffold3123_cov57-Attheya_sp.AAC.3
MAAAIKMDELLVSWLGSDTVYENVLNLIETQKRKAQEAPPTTATSSTDKKSAEASSTGSPRGVTVGIPPFYEPRVARRQKSKAVNNPSNSSTQTGSEESGGDAAVSSSSVVQVNRKWDGAVEEAPVRVAAGLIYEELGHDPPLVSPASTGSGDMPAGTVDERRYLTMPNFVSVSKEICGFPTFFNAPLYARILDRWNTENSHDNTNMDVVTFGMLEWYWKREMEPYDEAERFFRLLKQPDTDHIGRDDFLPYIKELLNDHPGLEFLSNHAEFQEKYAVTVVTRIFYTVNRCHSGHITLRQIRRSDLLHAFQQVDEEEDINKVTRYFSYEHFYVLYCRFWELDHDRDYRITRDDLLKYGDLSLSHMIVDRIFDAAPRPFTQGSNPQNAMNTTDDSSTAGGDAAAINREYLSYEDFIFFMLSEEDKSNEISVRYWFSCIDVDGDGKLNNMEMRSFYAVQLHRMQCMGHEIVPFEDMLCQMIDMIKPAHKDYLVVEDFLQPECCQVSGALFDALFNLNKYLQFEQRDPFMERQKREDEFETDWDRFACIDYNRLAMEEEAREEEAMEIDWVTVDDEDDDGEEFNSMGLGGASEAPF